MPCYRCGVRQVDPVRGHSPWQRGVRSNQQILVCPDCQVAPGLAEELDHCSRCGSIRLVRRLGEVECRACGFVVPPEGADRVPRLAAGQAPERPRDAAPELIGAAAPELAGDEAPGLAAEVAGALERMFGGSTRVPPASAALP